MESAITVDAAVTPRMYVEHGDLHGALQEAVYRELEDDTALQEFFGLYRPNRFIPEDTDTEMWEDTEDAVYTGSDPREATPMRGRYALVQFISTRDKTGYNYDKLASQFEHFERWPENDFDADEMQGGNTGWYVAAADLDEDDVPTVNAALAETADSYAARLRDDLMRETDDGALVHALGMSGVLPGLQPLIPGMEDRYRETVGEPDPPTETVPVEVYELERSDLAAIEQAVSEAFRMLFADKLGGSDD